MAYSNSVPTGPRLRLLSAIVATSFAIRTLALWPLLFAISPSRIRTLRMTAVFQPSLATKNLRSISRLMSGLPARLTKHPGLCSRTAKNSVMTRAVSFDHLVGGNLQGEWDFQSKRLCCLQIDHQLELGRRWNTASGRASNLSQTAS